MVRVGVRDWVIHYEVLIKIEVKGCVSVCFLWGAHLLEQQCVVVKADGRRSV